MRAAIEAQWVWVWVKETNTHRDLAYCFKKGVRSPNMIKSAGAATLSVTRSKSPALCGNEARSSMIGWFKAWAEFQSGRLVKMDRRLLTVQSITGPLNFTGPLNSGCWERIFQPFILKLCMYIASNLIILLSKLWANWITGGGEMILLLLKMSMPRLADCSKGSLHLLLTN